MTETRIEETTLAEFKKDCKKDGVTWPHIFQPGFKFPGQIHAECTLGASQRFPNDPKKQEIWFWYRYAKECRERGWGGWTKQEVKEILKKVFTEGFGEMIRMPTS